MDAIEVAAGLVFRNGRLLITQRLAGAHLAGFWEFPGGKREGEESFEECLRRELLEELGIEVSVGDLLESVLHSYPEKTVLLKFFLCQWIKNEPVAIGCSSLAWVDRPELKDYQFPAADAKLLEVLTSRGDLWG